MSLKRTCHLKILKLPIQHSSSSCHVLSELLNAYTHKYKGLKHLHATPILPISGEKSRKGALRSITKSLKNPNNCHSNCSDKKLPDTLLKTFLLKKPIYPHLPFHHASFTLLPSCLFSVLTPTLLLPTPGPGAQQELVMYRETELLTWFSLCIELQREHCPVCPSPWVFVCTKKKIPSYLGDAQLYQVRTL